MSASIVKNYQKVECKLYRKKVNFDREKKNMLFIIASAVFQECSNNDETYYEMKEDLVIVNSFFHDFTQTPVLIKYNENEQNYKINATGCSFFDIHDSTDTRCAGIATPYLNLTKSCFFNLSITTSKSDKNNRQDGVSLNAYYTCYASSSSFSLCKTTTDVYHSVKPERDSNLIDLNISNNGGSGSSLGYVNSDKSGTKFYVSYTTLHDNNNEIGVLWFDRHENINAEISNCNIINNTLPSNRGIVTVKRGTVQFKDCCVYGSNEPFIYKEEDNAATVKVESCYIENMSALIIGGSLSTNFQSTLTSANLQSMSGLFQTHLCSEQVSIRTMPPEGCPAAETPKKKGTKMKVVYSFASGVLSDAL